MNPRLLEVIQQLQNGQSHKHYTWDQQQLRRKGKLVVGPDSGLRLKLLQWGHDSSIGGHSGRDATITRIKGLFHWKGLNKEVSAYVRNWQTCQSCKYEASAYPGLLKPLPIPQEVWMDIPMYFIEGLPTSGVNQSFLWWWIGLVSMAIS